jgi:hypothetical protein
MRGREGSSSSSLAFRSSRLAPALVLVTRGRAEPLKLSLDLPFFVVMLALEKALAHPWRTLGRVALCVWVPASLVVIAVLMSAHLLALPTPASRVVEAALARAGTPRGAYRAYHVLYADCPCSRRVAESLVRRGARKDFVEEVLLVGHDPALASRLTEARFAVEEMTPESLKDRFELEAAPAFFAVAPDGVVKYLGGYTTIKQGMEEDDRILTLVHHGARPEPLPLFGCAVSRELQAKADPLGLKYSTGVR